MDFERLLPERGEIDVRTAASVLRDVARPHADRPYLVLNMVSTADGRVTVAGRSGQIGNEADRELFHELRAQVDAVMAGAGTVRTERYGRLVRDPDRRARRQDAGFAPDPLAVIVSGRLALTPDIPLLQDPDSHVVILTASDQEIEGCGARVDYLRADGATGAAEELQERAPRLTLAPLLRKLRDDYEVGTVLCEGGPRLNGALLQEKLVDELFLSVAPKLAAGPGPAVVEGPAIDPPAEMDLASVMAAGGHLFLRFRLSR
jgi:5-amino-6-(5-phosphoribosylamino)uracil reductase